MISTFLPLWAQNNVRVTFEWGRIQSNVDWILPIGVLLALLVYVVYMYLRDAAELRPVVGVILTLLRVVVFAALLIYYLQPQWRMEDEKTINSRALVMVDTSLSMGLTDNNTSAGSGGATRIQQVATALKTSDFIQRLRATHDVTVVAFDEELHRDRAITFPKLRPLAPGEQNAAGQPRADAAEDEQPQPLNAADADWGKALKLAGEETRLGQSVAQLIEDEANTPVAGVVVISDGGQNAGPGPEAVVNAAKAANLPVFAIGVGSDQQPPNVRVASFNPPPRAYPGDPYVVKGNLQSWHMAGQSVNVQLLARKAASGPASSTERGTGEVLDSQTVVLGSDGQLTAVSFQVKPEEIGRKTMCLKVVGVQNDRDPSDNLMETDVEVVDRKNHVLLFAGGPSREYQFLRNQLYRDKSTTSDILLQTARPGISQESAKILDEFPSTREEMFKYDCVVAFDPDWGQLDPDQVDVLADWVSKQGGGLIVVAGPVYTGNRPLPVGRDSKHKGEQRLSWVEDPRMKKIRDLYPVEFPRKLSIADSGTYESKEPWPLDFTREGLEAYYIALNDSPVESRQAWAGFPGVYGYFPVRGEKPVATVLARFSDPRTGQNGVQPVFMAWQNFGSGKVFYLGSGEIWRLNAQDLSYFTQFYTKLIRYVSSGRMNRESTRGVLLVDNERYRVGNVVKIRATQMLNGQLETLEVPNLTLQVFLPDQTMQSVTLRPDPTSPGSYVGQFTVLHEGDYRLELPLPDSDDERLSKRIRVEIPNLEREHPERNDTVLSQLATKTEHRAAGGERVPGKYFVGLDTVVDGNSPLFDMLKDRTKTIMLALTPSREGQEKWLLAMMLTLFGLLCIEWVIRRLAKLA